MAVIPFFSWLRNILLYTCTTSSLFLCQWIFRLLPCLSICNCGHFLTVFFFLPLSCMSCLYSMEVNPLWVTSCANILLLHSLSFHLVSFPMQNLISLICFCSVTKSCLTFCNPMNYTASQASLSFTIALSLLKLMSTESVMPSNHLILCQPLLLLPSIFPSLRVFSRELALHIWWPRIGASASLSALLMAIQGWYPLGLTGLISLLSNSQESSPAPLFESINSLAFSLLYGPTLTIHTWLLEKP